MDFLLTEKGQDLMVKLAGYVPVRIGHGLQVSRTGAAWRISRSSRWTWPTSPRRSAKSTCRSSTRSCAEARGNGRPPDGSPLAGLPSGGRLLCGKGAAAMGNPAKLLLEGIEKHFGGVQAVRGVTLEIPEGCLVSFLGPSGCGKTTSLRIVAGLEAPTKGRVLVDGRVLSDERGVVPPERRGMGMVFQSYAVWPHMTVFDNVAFGLRLRRWDREAIRQKVQSVLELVNMAEYAARYPTQLSGGQQQRVALARALATEPAILLLDEPLSNLDALLREKMRFEIRSLQQRLGHHHDLRDPQPGGGAGPLRRRGHHARGEACPARPPGGALPPAADPLRRHLHRPGQHLGGQGARPGHGRARSWSSPAGSGSAFLRRAPQPRPAASRSWSARSASGSPRTGARRSPRTGSVGGWRASPSRGAAWTTSSPSPGLRNPSAFRRPRRSPPGPARRWPSRSRSRTA